MTNFQQNNLAHSSSPYLLQHKDNPIYWQEWNKETLQYAKKNKKLIFLSIGYSTCHWCHVMAKEAFSDLEVASILNQHFVAIKIDREQYPDIDQYFLEYVTETQGQAGWPLNVILSPDRKPFFGGTYFPIEQKYGLPTFQYVLKEALLWYAQHKNELVDFLLNDAIPSIFYLGEETLIDTLENHFDIEWSGFGFGHKFPPHNTLLFLMTYYEKTADQYARAMIINTLDAMAQSGLHDHLQGGFFRYCTDESWHIPRFEKMLYDQAMHLWTYSYAYKLFKKPEYKIIVEKLVQCLEETFESDGLYYSAHDAEANDEEGKMYLWAEKELQEIFSHEEFGQFKNLYQISMEGNYHNKNHLIKYFDAFEPTLENKLLGVRKLRQQHFIDKKIITSWNALLGVAFMMAYRWVEIKNVYKKAQLLFWTLLEKHYKNFRLAHSSFENKVQSNEYLEDYAGLLLFAGYLYEDGEDCKKIIEQLSMRLNIFFDKKWNMNMATDYFPVIPANELDSPMPSPLALTEFARYRTGIIFQKNSFAELPFKKPLDHDFYNMVALLIRGGYHQIHSLKKLSWQALPLNSIQIRDRTYIDCYNYHCQQFQTEQDLLRYLSLQNRKNLKNP